MEKHPRAKEGEIKDNKKNSRRKKHTVGYVASVVVNIIMIVLFSNLRSWFPALTSAFNAILWLFYISFAAQIVFNLIFLVFDAPWFRALLQLLANVFSLVIMYSLLVIFPFALSPSSEGIARIVLYFLIFAIAIAVIVEMSRLVYYIFKAGRELNDER